MTSATVKNRTLKNHITHSKGSKTVCVTTCLNFFKIPFDAYHYTSSDRNVHTYVNVLRRFGWSVRSRKTEFKVIMGGITMTQLRRNMKKSEYTSDDYFIVSGYTSSKGHLMVLNGNGDTVIDTAGKNRWRIHRVSIVEKR